MLTVSRFCVAFLLAAGSVVAGYSAASTAETDKLALIALGKLGVHYAAQKDHGSCTIKKAAVRREW